VRRGPLLVAASASGLAGVLALHAGHSPSLLAGPIGHGPSAATPTTSTTGPSPTTQPVPAPGSPSTVQSAVGATEQYGYGDLAVKVTVEGGRITGITVPLLQTAEPYSQSLAQQVIPMLQGEVLAAQSAQISGVSGATYTSEAYAYSLQAALDSLHFK
jgi:uncharacterized protein with FMN-binding domain